MEELVNDSKNITKNTKKFTMTNTTSDLPWGLCRATFEIFGLNNIEVPQLPKPEVMKTFELLPGVSC